MIKFVPDMVVVTTESSVLETVYVKLVVSISSNRLVSEIIRSLLFQTVVTSFNGVLIVGQSSTA